MRYEKPVVMNLGARAASGQDPLACVDGDSPSDGICNNGTAGTSVGDCVSGGSAPNAVCASGGGPGSSGSCTSGPVFG